MNKFIEVIVKMAIGVLLLISFYNLVSGHPTNVYYLLLIMLGLIYIKK
jgi:hypothetical protein